MTNYTSARTCALAASLFLGVLALSCRPGPREAAPAADKPNVILIVLDGARADRFGVYGCQHGITPRMDEIARGGAVFLRHLTNGIRTRDAIPIMLSSSYRKPDLFEVRGKDLEWGIRELTPESVFQGRPAQQFFLPEVMKQTGWRTAIFNNILYIAEFNRLKTYFDEVFDLPFPTIDQARDEVMVSTLLKWIGERDPGTPFFAYYHILSPHAPFPVKEEDVYFLSGFDPDKIAEVRHRANLIEWDQEYAEIATRLHMGNLKHSDRWVGELFDGLNSMGLLDNTIIIITSDHGEPRRDLIRPTRPPGNLFIKVPLIIHYPPKVAAVSRVNTLTESVDIVPTIFSLAGIEMPPGNMVDGVNLMGYIDESAERDRLAYIHDLGVCDRRYIYYPREDDPDEEETSFWEEALFDLETDPFEEHNIIERETDVATRLAAYFEDIRSSPYPPTRRQSPPGFPFYYTFDRFQSSPPDLPVEVETISGKQETPYESWMLVRRHDQSSALVRSPAVSSPPLTLSAPLPDGSYRVSLMLETAGRVSLNPVELGLLFRFSAEEEFMVPENVEFFGNSARGIPRYYIDLGETAVRREFISLDIDWQPREDKPLHLLHVKFLPENILQPVVYSWEDDITLALRMIGYLDYDVSAAEAVHPDMLASIDWGENLLLRDNVTLTASSQREDSQRVEKILDNNPHTFWHAIWRRTAWNFWKADSGQAEWLVVDFGQGGDVAVSSLAARPRIDADGGVFGNAGLQPLFAELRMGLERQAFGLRVGQRAHGVSSRCFKNAAASEPSWGSTSRTSSTAMWSFCPTGTEWSLAFSTYFSSTIPALWAKT